MTRCRFPPSVWTAELLVFADLRLGRPLDALRHLDEALVLADRSGLRWAVQQVVDLAAIALHHAGDVAAAASVDDLLDALDLGVGLVTTWADLRDRVHAERAAHLPDPAPPRRPTGPLDDHTVIRDTRRLVTETLARLDGIESRADPEAVG